MSNLWRDVRYAARVLRRQPGFAAVAVLVLALGIGTNLAVFTREIGIRMALGATERNVVGLVVREGAVVTAWAAGIGLLLALGIGQLLASMLYEVSAVDPLTFLAAPVVLGAAALAACFVPARRAARVSPTVALRYE